MITIEQLNQWQDLVRSKNNAPIHFESFKQECRENGLEPVMEYLINNNIVARMKDGNMWVNWSSNKYYPEATFINLKSELTNGTRKPTLEERVEIIEQWIKEHSN